MSRLKWGCGGATKGFDGECGGGKMSSVIWEDLCLGPQVDTDWLARETRRQTCLIFVIVDSHR